MKDVRETELSVGSADDEAQVVFKLIRGRWIEQAPESVEPEQPVRISFDGIPLPGARRLI